MSRSQLDERLRERGVTETLHGMTVEDPYRALEKPSALTEAWIRKQTQRTRHALKPHRSAARRERLRELLSIGTLSDVKLGGERVFFTMREGEREQAALYCLSEPGAQPRLLVDPEALSEKAAVDWHYPSPDGRHVAYGISYEGDERSTLHVLDVESGGTLPERIDHAKWSQITWLHDEPAFYYRRYPYEGEPGYDPEHPDSYHLRIYFHRLGTDPTEDPLVFEGERKTDFPATTLSRDDRWLVVHNYRSWTATDVYLFDRGAGEEKRVAPDEAHPLAPVWVGEDHLAEGRVQGDALYLYTDMDAPRGRILRAPLAHVAERERWRELVPEGEHAIEDWQLLRSALVVHTLDEASSRLRAISLRSGRRHTLRLPERGAVTSLAAHPDGRTLGLVFSSFFQPPTLMAYRPGRGRPRAWHRVSAALDEAAYAASEITVRSRDGTPIHLFYLHPPNLKVDADRPVLVHGYGGFGIPQQPQFTRNALYWVEQGGVYVVPNLRGGGEGGEAWHRAGMREHKEHVFEDMEAVLHWVLDSGLSGPERLAITGSSNGGLLVGAMLTRVPQLLGAAVGYVGLYDMLRYHHFPPAELWTSEYGDPRDPRAARYLHAYSPYHQIEEGVSYPATLLETADHDTRVHWSHTAKMAARLQHTTASDAPVYFYMERKVGHGHGTRLSDLVDRYARMYAFLEAHLGMTERRPAP